MILTNVLILMNVVCSGQGSTNYHGPNRSDIFQNFLGHGSVRSEILEFFFLVRSGFSRSWSELVPSFLNLSGLVLGPVFVRGSLVQNESQLQCKHSMSKHLG